MCHQQAFLHTYLHAKGRRTMSCSYWIQNGFHELVQLPMDLFKQIYIYTGITAFIAFPVYSLHVETVRFIIVFWVISYPQK